MSLIRSCGAPYNTQNNMKITLKCNMICFQLFLFCALRPGSLLHPPPPPFHSFQYNILQKIYFHFGGVELSKHLEVKEQKEKNNRQRGARSNEHVVYEAEANINEMTKTIWGRWGRWEGASGFDVSKSVFKQHLGPGHSYISSFDVSTQLPNKIDVGGMWKCSSLLFCAFRISFFF